jgi:hypothetical protein
MREFDFTFRGRKAGAIGVAYFVATTIKAASLAEAYKVLYGRYEHIQFLKLDGREIERPEWPGGDQ